jgi:hypothetical protein
MGSSTSYDMSSVGGPGVLGAEDLGKKVSPLVLMRQTEADITAQGWRRRCFDRYRRRIKSRPTQGQIRSITLSSKPSPRSRRRRR